MYPPSYGQTMFHCVDIPHFVIPFSLFKSKKYLSRSSLWISLTFLPTESAKEADAFYPKTVGTMGLWDALLSFYLGTYPFPELSVV
jgi:hypothetical protein